MNAAASRGGQTRQEHGMVAGAVFLGIDCECDPEFNYKLGHLFETAFKQAGEPQETIQTFKSMVRQRQ